MLSHVVCMSCMSFFFMFYTGCTDVYVCICVYCLKLICSDLVDCYLWCVVRRVSRHVSAKLTCCALGTAGFGGFWKFNLGKGKKGKTKKMLSLCIFSQTIFFPCFPHGIQLFVLAAGLGLNVIYRLFSRPAFLVVTNNFNYTRRRMLKVSKWRG